MRLGILDQTMASIIKKFFNAFMWAWIEFSKMI